MEYTGGSRNSDKLSKRQRQCIELAGDGMTSKEIGRALSISPSTVDNHIQVACDKLNARNRTDAARLYREMAVPLAENSGGDLTWITERKPVVDGKPSNQSWIRLFFTLPPIGGRANEISTYRRLFHLVQISLLALAVMTAGILTIAGLVHVLSDP